MCDFLMKADPLQYEHRTRTVRLKNTITSIRLENLVWDTLAEIAEEMGCTTNALISELHDEILAEVGEVPNFASILRVTCMRYLRQCILALEKVQPASTPTVLNQASEMPAFESAPKMLAAVGRSLISRSRSEIPQNSL